MGSPDNGRFKEIVIRPAARWRSLGVCEVFLRFDLLRFLVWRDIKVRYSQTLLGIFWAILQPLMTMAIFSLLFGRLIGVPSDGVPYPLFSLAGLVLWTFFIQGLTSASASIVSNQGLVEKVYFPRLALPMAAIFGGVLDLIIGLGILLFVVLLYGLAPQPQIIAAVVFAALAGAVALGVGAGLGALNVRFRDIRHLVPFVSQIWLFATPVAYPSSLIPKDWQWLAGLNPLSGLVEGFRWAILGTPLPAWPLMAVSITVSLLILFAGLATFRKLESTFADTI